MRYTLVKPKVDWFSFTNYTDQANYLGKQPNGFRVVSETCTDLGVVEITYTYDTWDFNLIVLIVPILDSNYVQVIFI